MRAEEAAAALPRRDVTPALILRRAHAATRARPAQRSAARAPVSKDGGGHRSCVSRHLCLSKHAIAAASKAEEDSRNRLGSELLSLRATSPSPAVRMQSRQ